MADKSKFLIRKHWIVVKCYDLTEFLRYVYVISRCTLNYQGLNHWLYVGTFSWRSCSVKTGILNNKSYKCCVSKHQSFMEYVLPSKKYIPLFQWLSQMLIFLFRLFQIQLYHITMVSKAVFNTKFWFHLLTFLW